MMAGGWQFGMEQFDFQPRLMQKLVQLAGAVMCGTMRRVGNKLPHLLNHKEQMEQFPDGFMTFYLVCMHGITSNDQVVRCPDAVTANALSANFIAISGEFPRCTL